MIGYVLQAIVCGIFFVVAAVQIFLLTTPLFIFFVDISSSVPAETPLSKEHLVPHACVLDIALMIITFLGMAQAVLAYKYQRYVRTSTYKNLIVFQLVAIIITNLCIIFTGVVSYFFLKKFLEEE